ncbi:FecR domain-containing protein [Zoogloea sp.]|uniref:FecR domain-containing protein n=1 Tax=Zoogloea sp. TaxID=49181 RepID=UPI0035AECAA0
MATHTSKIFTPSTLSLALAFGFGSWTLPALACSPIAGTLNTVEGRVEMRAATGSTWQTAQVKQTLCPGDQLAVRGPGRASVVLSQNVLVRLDQDTTLTLPAADKGELGLGKGIVHVISRYSKRFGILTPFVNAMVDGTEFTVDANDDRTQVSVSEGKVRTVNDKGETVLLPGDASETGPNAAPHTIQIRPRDAVAWAIHYPYVLRLADADIAAYPAALGARLQAARQAADEGRFHDAAAGLDRLPELKTDPRLAALQADYLLGFGRVDQARALLAGFTQPDASLNAVRTLLDLSKGDSAAALAKAQEAVRLEANSAAAWLALSYAQQAAHQLPEARRSAEQATRLSEAHPAAWARRAELELGQGLTREGGESARKALELSPRMADARALAAFAQLAQGRTSEAEAGFKEAIELNPAAPLGHFGLGLAQMRQGQLAEGRRSLEVAALLDPDNAELRSYLGRAYMEENNDKQAQAQLDLARRLDPASPTPWYFDAFRKQLAHQPLAAVLDAEKALALNDNRAVLRSTEVLSQDKAARDVSLGSAYQQVGFEAAARASALDALDADPQSAAAHRLLAESYAADPELESARLSEQLQAKLRQPIGTWPLPPQFVMPSLPVLGGPSTISPDEGTAFFDRQPTHFAASLGAGNRGIRMGSVMASHAWEKAQLSVGGFDYRGDAFKAGSYDTHLSGTTLSFQWAPVSALNLFTEYSHTERTTGDIAQRLYPTQAYADNNLVRNTTLTDRFTLGAKYAIAPGEELLMAGSTARVRQTRVSSFDFELDDGRLLFDFTQPARVQTNSLAALYSKAGGVYSFDFGGVYYRQIGSLKSFLTYYEPTQDVEYYDPYSRNVDKNSVYGRFKYAVIPGWDIHAGLDYVHLESTDLNTSVQSERMLGKFGVVGKPAEGVTVRAAFMQGVSGSSLDQESLLPTEFAGFNQSFDDPSGTRWHQGGAGIAFKTQSGLRAGLEGTRRSLAVPDFGCYISPCSGAWHESKLKASVSQPFGDRFALSGEWLFTKRDAAQTPYSFDVPDSLRTHLIPFRLWARVGEGSLLVENWMVRQTGMVSQNDGVSESRMGARSNFDVVNLRYTYPVITKSLTASLIVNNIFDRKFDFQDTAWASQARTPLFYPHRTVFVQGSLRF